MNVLKPERKLAILSALTEGCSIRSVSRMTGAHIETILKLLLETGQKAQAMLDERMRGIQAEAIECDELWCYIAKKQRHLTDTDRLAHPEYGDTYTFIALDPATKLVPSFFVGKRDVLSTQLFMADLARRIEGPVQLSTDGFGAYVQAIQQQFGFRATHAEIVKLYAAENPGPGRYSPPHCTGVEIHDRWGIPDRSKVCTSYVERLNLTVRMQIRRFTRLTNGFSRKLENLQAAVALFFWNWNFAWCPRTIRCTPAMQAGLTDRIWKLEELLA
ncbi:MAG: IS1 family transposase [Nitrospirae bacterium]|nr:IS1 family transposase [Nitrospirota bacterium]